MGVEAGVHGDYGCRGTFFGEHSDENEIGVVDPFEFIVGLHVEAFGFEHFHAAFAGGEVGFEFVVYVF